MSYARPRSAIGPTVWLASTETGSSMAHPEGHCLIRSERSYTLVSAIAITRCRRSSARIRSGKAHWRGSMSSRHSSRCVPSRASAVWRHALSASELPRRTSTRLVDITAAIGTSQKGHPAPETSNHGLNDARRDPCRYIDQPRIVPHQHACPFPFYPSHPLTFDLVGSPSPRKELAFPLALSPL